MSITLSQKKAIARLAEPLLRALKLLLRLTGYLPARMAHRPRFRLPLPSEDETKNAGSAPQPKKILVVRLDSIGDVLLTEPAISALRRRYPQAVLDVAVGSLGKAALEGNPAIDSFVLYEAPWHAAWRGSKVSWRKEMIRLWGAVRQIRRGKYDLVAELRGDFRDIIFALVSGSEAIVGSGWRGGGSLLDYDVPFDTRVHQVSFALAIAGGAGADQTPRPPRLALDDTHHRQAQAVLAGCENATLIALHLGAGFPSKCLPIGKLATAVEGIVERWTPRLGSPPAFVIVGGADEQKTANTFRQLSRARVIDLTGRLTLKGTAAVLARCDLFIGNDSGPMHLAAAVGTPVVTFFGPSEPFRFHPYGVPYELLEVDLSCRPCDFVHCVHSEFRCLSLLKEDRIIQAAEDLLMARSAIGGQPSAKGQ